MLMHFPSIPNPSNPASYILSIAYKNHLLTFYFYLFTIYLFITVIVYLLYQQHTQTHKHTPEYKFYSSQKSKNPLAI